MKRHSTDKSDGSGWNRKVLRGRYKISEDEVLGRGGMAIVYKGLDTEACKNVAVKIWSTQPGDDSKSDHFAHSVQVLQDITGNQLFAQREPQKTSRNKKSKLEDFGAYYNALGARAESMAPTGSMDSAAANMVGDKDFLELFDVRNCFVKLLDYSKTEDGEPGMDEMDHMMWLVFEIGKESLAELLHSISKDNTTMKESVLRDLQWTLVSIVWGLHAAGYVHLDIKPQNIMKFSVDGRDQWKLIDLDGAVHSGEALSLQAVTFTPEYMPPELAKALINIPNPNDKLVTSRLMDVWSVGMCAMEAIFLQPVLSQFYDKWQTETGSDSKFFKWLGNFESDPIMSDDMKEYIGGINEDMSDLLVGMLAKNPAKRYCIGQCLAHPWFEPVRGEIMKNFISENASEHDRAEATPTVKCTPTERERRRMNLGAKACAVM